MSGNQDGEPGCSKPVPKGKRKRKSVTEDLEERFAIFEANLRVAVRQECQVMFGAMVPELVKYLREHVQVPPATATQSNPSPVQNNAKEIDQSTTPTSVAGMISLGYNPPTFADMPKTAETPTAGVEIKTAEASAPPPPAGELAVIPTEAMLDVQPAPPAGELAVIPMESTLDIPPAPPAGELAVTPTEATLDVPPAPPAGELPVMPAIKAAETTLTAPKEALPSAAPASAPKATLPAKEPTPTLKITRSRAPTKRTETPAASTTDLKGKAKKVKKQKSKEKQPVIDPNFMTDEELQVYIAASGEFGTAEDEGVGKYEPGEKLIRNVEDVSKELGVSCASLEEVYLDNFKKPESERVSGIIVSYKAEAFHHDVACTVFPVNWDDLFDLLNLREMDASVMRCLTL